MKTIEIYLEDVNPKARYICDAEGKCDLLGQILTTGFDINIPPKTRTPQDLCSSIRWFVTCYRGYTYSNTGLTQQLLDNASLPSRKQMEAANKLLNPIGINLIVANTTKELERIEEQRSKETTVTFTNLFRTSMLHCSCGQNSSLSSLVEELDDDDKVSYSCPYCLTTLSSQLNQEIEKQAASYK